MPRIKYEPLPKDYVNFSEARIVFGSSVAFFFFKKGFSKVIFEYDYKNKTLIIEGINPEKLKTAKYPIHEGISIFSIKTGHKKNPWAFFVDTRSHREIVDFSRRFLRFKAEPFSEDKVIVRDLPLIPIVKAYSTIFDAELSKVIFHSTISQANLAQVSKPHKVEGATYTQRWIDKLKTLRPIGVPHNVVRTEPKVQSMPQQVQTAAPKGIVDKEIGNVWGFETPPEKLPSKEEREMMDRMNKKIILGE